MKTFEMKVILSIFLLVSYVANGIEDGTCNLYDRRGLVETPAAGDAAGGAAAPAGGAAGPAGAAGGDGVFDISKCPNAKGDGSTDVTQVTNHIFNLTTRNFALDIA